MSHRRWAIWSLVAVVPVAAATVALGTTIARGAGLYPRTPVTVSAIAPGAGVGKNVAHRVLASMLDAVRIESDVRAEYHLESRDYMTTGPGNSRVRWRIPGVRDPEKPSSIVGAGDVEARLLISWASGRIASATLDFFASSRRSPKDEVRLPIVLTTIDQVDCTTAVVQSLRYGADGRLDVAGSQFGTAACDPSVDPYAPLPPRTRPLPVAIQEHLALAGTLRELFLGAPFRYAATAVECDPSFAGCTTGLVDAEYASAGMVTRASFSAFGPHSTGDPISAVSVHPFRAALAGDDGVIIDSGARFAIGGLLVSPKRGVAVKADVQSRVLPIASGHLDVGHSTVVLRDARLTNAVVLLDSDPTARQAVIRGSELTGFGRGTALSLRSVQAPVSVTFQDDKCHARDAARDVTISNDSDGRDTLKIGSSAFCLTGDLGTLSPSAAALFNVANLNGSLKIDAGTWHGGLPAQVSADLRDLMGHVSSGYIGVGKSISTRSAELKADYITIRPSSVTVGLMSLTNVAAGGQLPLSTHTSFDLSSVKIGTVIVTSPSPNSSLIVAHDVSGQLAQGNTELTPGNHFEGTSNGAIRASDLTLISPGTSYASGVMNVALGFEHYYRNEGTTARCDSGTAQAVVSAAGGADPTISGPLSVNYVPSYPAGSACVFYVSHTQVSYPQIVPPVNNSDTENPFPSYRYWPGDRVTVDAGGCVNDHGFGATSKRYVLPEGGDSGNYYSGTIYLPGWLYMPFGLNRFEKFHSSWHILDRVRHPDRLYLRLGYQDDHPEDNDYNKIDEGTPVQCGPGQAHYERQKYRRNSAREDPAYVEMSVEHPDIEAPDAPGDADMVFDELDDNDIPVNPIWGKQLRGGGYIDPDKDCDRFTYSNDVLSLGDPPCSGIRPTIDDAGWSHNIFTCHGGDRPNGHINFGAVTMSGSVYYKNYEFGPFGVLDHDFNLELWRPDLGLLTTANEWPGDKPNKAIDLEFLSEEVRGFTSPWWQDFYTLGVGDEDAARAHMSNLPAIAIGLMGLDCVHGCASELHPVFGLAVNVPASEPDSERWAVFGRTWGNEGYCSERIHHLNLDSMSFDIVMPAGATGWDVLPTTRFATTIQTADVGGIAPVPAQYSTSRYENRLVLNVQLGPDGTKVDGELHIRWITKNGIAAATTMRTYPTAPRILRGTTESDQQVLSAAAVKQFNYAARARFENTIERSGLFDSSPSTDQIARSATGLTEVALTSRPDRHVKFGAHTRSAANDYPSDSSAHFNVLGSGFRYLPGRNLPSYRSNVSIGERMARLTQLQAVCAALSDDVSDWPRGTCAQVRKNIQGVRLLKIP